MSRMKRAAIAAALALSWGLVPPARALALRSGAASVAVNGLSPGRSCRLADCARTKLSLTNTGGEPAAVALSVAKPEPADLQDGYEAAPSASWVTLERGGWTLAPGSEGVTDAVVSVPGDGRLKPGQYQLNWLADGRGAGGLSLRLRSRLLLRVEDSDDEDWKRERERAAKRPDAGLALLGGGAGARRAPLGRKVALRELGAAVKAANLGERRELVRLRVRAPDPARIPRGYEPCPNPGFLEAPKRLPSEAGRVAEVPLELTVPDQARYRGRHWAFEVTAQALEAAGEEPQSAVVLVDTEGSAAR